MLTGLTWLVIIINGVIAYILLDNVARDKSHKNKHTGSLFLGYLLIWNTILLIKGVI